MKKILEYLPALLIFAFVIMLNAYLTEPKKQWVEKWMPASQEPDSMYRYNNDDILEDTFYHKVDTLSNGVITGCLGAITWLIDANGKKMSSGYHEIRPTDSGYFAKLGAIEYKLSETGRLLLIKEVKYE